MSANVYENAPRYTAKEIEDGLYSGMDPDVELVAAQYYDALRAELARATRALERAGFTDNGAEEWKPPLGWGDTGTQRERLIALEDKLARVKAESLRVVVVPAPDHGLIYDWYMTPTGLGYPGKDRKQNNCIESAEGYYRLDECKPVRLERWEDE